MRLFGRADARAFLLVLDVGLAHRHALHRERDPPRRRERLGALVDETGRDQLVGDELSQILRRPRLHARRDFLGEEFEQEIGHGLHRPALRRAVSAARSPPREAVGRGQGWGAKRSRSPRIRHSTRRPCSASHRDSKIAGHDSRWLSRMRPALHRFGLARCDYAVRRPIRSPIVLNGRQSRRSKVLSSLVCESVIHSPEVRATATTVFARPPSYRAGGVSL